MCSLCHGACSHSIGQTAWLRQRELLLPTLRPAHQIYTHRYLSICLSVCLPAWLAVCLSVRACVLCKTYPHINKSFRGFAGSEGIRFNSIQLDSTRFNSIQLIECHYLPLHDCILDAFQYIGLPMCPSYA